jgi:hypothetical protein
MGFRLNSVDIPRATANRASHRRQDWRLTRDVDSELKIVRRHPANVLLVGHPAATRVALEMLRPDLREPIVTWHPGQALELPPPACATTLVLHDVDQLTPGAQAALLRCVDHGVGQLRVISTSKVPLWPQVERGVFSETLYYRLNVVYLELSPSA